MNILTLTRVCDVSPPHISDKQTPDEYGSSEFDVSRKTARHALKQLESEGLVQTIEGRKSRFVSLPKVEYDLSKTISFFASSTYGKNDLETLVLDKKIMIGTDEQCESLGLSKNANIHSYSPLRMLDNKPAFIEQEYVSEKRFTDLWGHDIAQPIIMLFDRVYGVQSV